MTYAGVLGVIIGGAIFLVALFSNPDADPECDGKVMTPSDICKTVGSSGGTITSRTYDEVKADNAGKKDGLYLGPPVLIAAIAVAVAGSRLDKSDAHAA